MKPESQKVILETAQRAVKICNGVYHGAAVAVIESAIASCISQVALIEDWQHSDDLDGPTAGVEPTAIETTMPNQQGGQL